MIPVYNEAEYLEACLLAIAKQTIKPHEVIVVDNNSTDNTAAIAKRFNFVSLISESRQGVIHARSQGFNAASGDIIGRIDADTILAKDWISTISMIFKDQTVGAVSGSVTYHDLPCRNTFGKIELFFRSRIAAKMGDEVFLYGANMAIRKAVWRRAMPALCVQGGLHEDFDLAIHAQETGARIIFDQRLRAAVSLRRFNSSLSDFWCYARLNPRTYAAHGRTSQRHMYPAISLVLLSFWAIKLLHRGYNTDSGQFSWQKLFDTSAIIRVNPATFVDSGH